MRYASTNDEWRKLFSRVDLPLGKLTVKFRDVTEIGTQSIEVRPPISLICGENGVGKSTLLWTIYRALAPNARVEGGHGSSPPKVPSGQIDSVEILVNSEGKTATFDDISSAFKAINVNSEERHVTFVDPTFQIPELIRAIRSDENFADLLEGVNPTVFDRERLEQINFLVGRDYEEVRVFEIENYSDYEIFPYFTVKASGVSYGSERMGLGELSLFYLLWTFICISSPSIVLLEEPETFVAPRSQRALIDLAAKFCNEKKLSIIISSHSGIIAERVPNANLSLVTRGNPHAIISSDPAAHLLIDRLGIFPLKTSLLLVEDESAKALLSSLLFNIDSRLATSCEVAVAGSDSGITNALKSIPKANFKRFRLVGVYDGDARNNDDIKKATTPWPRLFLPGDTCPELMLQEHVKALGQRVATELGKSEVDVQTALGGAAGKNHHDWLTEVSSALRISPSEFIDRLVPSWIQQNQALATEFAKLIKVVTQ